MEVQVDKQVLKEDIQASSIPLVIGSIDQGTSSTRFLAFTVNGRVVASSQIEHKQYYPKTGWHEHDPIEIWTNVVACIDAVAKAIANEGLVLVSPKDERKKGHCTLAAIGITNQRETTVAWNKVTGKPYYNAIVWDDLRTAAIADEIAAGNINRLRAKTGLPLASYFAGTKVRWLLDNVPEIRRDLEAKDSPVAFGTIDTWLLYQLTGTDSKTSGAANCGGIFATDVTNASRWLFMELKSQKWDSALVQTMCGKRNFDLQNSLPSICPSSHIFGVCHPKCGAQALLNVPVASVLGDQQAALFGQTAFAPGEAKNTYGTGLFLMMVRSNDPA